MLRETPNTEAVIVEYGFLDNARDAAKLKSNYTDYAEAVVRAVMQYKGLPYTPPKNSGTYYTVKSGDTLWTIAKRNGLTVDELKTLNNLTTNSLTIGQILKIQKDDENLPSDNIEENYYIVKAGDTLYNIANRFGLSVNELKALNNLNNNILSIGQKLSLKSSTPPSTENIVYTVISGDSLYKIANKYGVTVDALKNANNLTSNLLSIGQKLIIPENANEYSTYTVQAGDTLYGIALKNGTTVDKIKSINNLISNTLSIGQKLLIP